MKVLGFDPSSTCIGIASIEDGGTPKAWVYRPKGATHDEKCVAIRKMIRATIAAEKPDFVGIEAPRLGMKRKVKADDDMITGEKMVGNPETDAILSRVNGILGEVCVEMAIPYDRVADATHRKSFVGTGRFASGRAKDATLAQCRLIGMTITSKDAADAVSVAWWSAGQVRMSIVPDGDLFKTEAE